MQAVYLSLAVSGIVCLGAPGVSHWEVSRHGVHVVEDAWPHMPARHSLTLTRLSVLFDEPVYWRQLRGAVELLTESATDAPGALLGVHIACRDSNEDLVSVTKWAPLASGYSRVSELWPDEFYDSSTEDSFETSGHAYSDGVSPNLIRLLFVSKSTEPEDGVGVGDSLYSRLRSGFCTLIVSPATWLHEPSESPDGTFQARTLSNAYGDPLIASLPLLRSKSVLPAVSLPWTGDERSADSLSPSATSSSMPRPRTVVLAPPATQPCAVRFASLNDATGELRCRNNADSPGDFYMWASAHCGVIKPGAVCNCGVSRVDLELRISELIAWAACSAPAMNASTDEEVSSSTPDVPSEQPVVVEDVDDGDSVLLETPTAWDLRRTARRESSVASLHSDDHANGQRPLLKADLSSGSAFSPDASTADLIATFRRNARASIQAALGSFGGHDDGAGTAPPRFASGAPPRPLRVTLEDEAVRSHYVDSDAISDYDVSLLELDALPVAVAKLSQVHGAADSHLPPRTTPEVDQATVSAELAPAPALRRLAPESAKAMRSTPARTNSAGSISGRSSRRSGEDAVMLEAAAGLRAALAARVPGLKKIIEPIVGMVLDPVTEQIIPAIGDQLKDATGGGLMASASADIPTPVIQLLSAALTYNLTSLLSDSIPGLIVPRLTEAITRKVSPSIRKALLRDTLPKVHDTLTSAGVRAEWRRRRIAIDWSRQISAPKPESSAKESRTGTDSGSSARVRSAAKMKPAGLAAAAESLIDAVSRPVSEVLVRDLFRVIQRSLVPELTRSLGATLTASLTSVLQPLNDPATHVRLPGSRGVSLSSADSGIPGGPSAAPPSLEAAYGLWGALSPPELALHSRACSRCTGLLIPLTAAEAAAATARGESAVAAVAREMERPAGHPSRDLGAPSPQPPSSADCLSCRTSPGPYAPYLHHYISHYFGAWYSDYFATYYSQFVNATDDALAKDADARELRRLHAEAELLRSTNFRPVDP